jgi:hypothetical protein
MTQRPSIGQNGTQKLTQRNSQTKEAGRRYLNLAKNQALTTIIICNNSQYAENLSSTSRTYNADKTEATSKEQSMYFLNIQDGTKQTVISPTGTMPSDTIIEAPFSQPCTSWSHMSTRSRLKKEENWYFLK